MASLDSFKSRKKLTVGNKTYHYFSLKAAEKNGLAGVSALPYSMKVLLENLLRNEDGRSVTKDDIQGVAEWLVEVVDQRSQRIGQIAVADLQFVVLGAKVAGDQPGVGALVVAGGPLRISEADAEGARRLAAQPRHQADDDR